MTREERQKIYENIEGFLVIVVIIQLVILIFAACNLYALSNEHIDSPGSHLFHSIAAGIGSLGCSLGGQVEGAISLGVDSVSHLFDFFDAYDKQTQHDKSVANTQDTIFWSGLFLVLSSIVCVVWEKRLKPKLESSLVASELS